MHTIENFIIKQIAMGNMGYVTYNCLPGEYNMQVSTDRAAWERMVDLRKIAAKMLLKIMYITIKGIVTKGNITEEQVRVNESGSASVPISEERTFEPNRKTLHNK
jgi:hypothetical protein